MSYLLKRCDSMLAHINLVGRVHVFDIHEDDERVVKQLVIDNKLAIDHRGNDVFYTSVNAKGYIPVEMKVDPVAFFIASQNPANEQFVKVFRKNWETPQLPDYEQRAEVEYIDIAE